MICVERKLEKNLRKAPEGRLRISGNSKRVEYYLSIVIEGKREYMYVGRDKLQLAKLLAQKEYNDRLLQSIEKELECISNYLLNIEQNNMISAYEGLKCKRRKLVIPLIETDDEYRERWINESYEIKQRFDDKKELYKDKGERVRSKSEIIIAKKLISLDIPYHYEKPLTLKNGKKLHPDFTLLDVTDRREIYYEHLGMMAS